MCCKHCFCILVALTASLGCNRDDSVQWLHPRKCAIRNATNQKMDAVEMSLVTEKWEIAPMSILPGETRVVALPEGKIPNMVLLGWDEAPRKIVSSLIYLDSIDSEYDGDILFTIFDMNISRPKVEAIDLSKVEINGENASVPEDIQK